MDDITRKAWLWLIGLTAVKGLLLFALAGTFGYWQAWIYLAIFFSASALMTAYLIRRDPALLQRRLKGGARAEKEPAQKIIMSATSIGFIALLAIPALDYRFGWSAAPVAVVIAGDVLVALGFAIIDRVYRENSYASATIEVAADQRVIESGPYSFVRHPMYFGGLVYLIGMPLALGSFFGLLPLAAIAPLLVWRLLDEERLLRASLPGYQDYCARLRWRLIPGVF